MRETDISIVFSNAVTLNTPQTITGVKELVCNTGVDGDTFQRWSASKNKNGAIAIFRNDITVGSIDWMQNGFVGITAVLDYYNTDTELTGTPYRLGIMNKSLDTPGYPVFMIEKRKEASSGKSTEYILLHQGNLSDFIKEEALK